MNRFPLKLLGLTLATALLTGLSASGQTDSDNDTIQVKAIVLNPLTVTAGSDLDFGYILSDGSANEITADSAEAGSFTIDGTADEDVDVSFTAPSTLTHTGAGTGTVTFSAGEYRYHLGGTTQSSGTTVTNLTTATLSPTVDEFGIWIGGTLTASAGADPGEYTGDFTLTVEYVN